MRKQLATTLALVLALIFAAKAEENGDVKLLESITDDNGNVKQKLEYDDKTRIVKIYDYSGEAIKIKTITYNSESLITVEEMSTKSNCAYSTNSGIYPGYSVDSTKYVKKGNSIMNESDTLLTLNKDGYIVKKKESYGIVTYRYENGNLVGKEGGDDESYRYDDKKSPFSNSNTPKWLLLILGYNANKNNAVGYDGPGEGSSSEYEYDSEDFPTKMTNLWEREECEPVTTIEHFTYCAKTKCTALKSEEASSSFAAAKQAVEKKEKDRLAAADKAEETTKSAILAAAAEYVKAEREKALKEGRTFIDERDGKTYMWVKIGAQTWMAENLNYNAEGSTCYNGNENKCLTYGRFYNRSAALKACPKGWHLPSNGEWNILYRFADGENGTESPYSSKTAGKFLKAKSGWSGKGNGTDDHGFSALPGGFGSNRNFSRVGESGGWWSSTEYTNDKSLSLLFYYQSIGNEDDGAYWGNGYVEYTSDLYSIRCVKD